MKAVFCESYGPPDVLKIKNVDRPVPGANELLIKIYASSVNAADCNVRGLTYIPTGLNLLAKLMLGFKKPKISIIGSVFAGIVEEIGKDIEQFKVGDAVFGTGPKLGAYAEYMCRQENNGIALMPTNTTFAEAATIPYGALTALYFIRDLAGIEKGQKVLINGASGGVGVYAVQLSRYFGAEVTGVCSTENINFVKSLGAHNVIDYTQQDVALLGEKWDIIFDVVVGKTSFLRFKKSLTNNGYYLAVAGGIKEMLFMIWTSITGGKKVKFGGGTAAEKKENITFIAKLIQSGDIKPVLNKTFNLEDIVEAHRYAEANHKRGNITISINQSPA